MNRLPYDVDKMRRQAEEKLGWKHGESNAFSFPALAAMLPPGKLKHEFDVCIRTESHILSDPRPLADWVRDHRKRRFPAVRLP